MVIVSPDRSDRSAAGFTALERAVFAYRLGEGRPDYHGDPIAIDRRYQAVAAGEGQGLIEAAFKRPNASVRLLAYRKLAIRSWAAFGLPSYSEEQPEGLTIGEGLVLIERWLRWQETLTEEFRTEAEMIAIYGHRADQPLDYRRECGLWFNRTRAQGIAALAHWRGALAATGRVRVDFNIVDALAATLEAAEDLDEELESARAAAAEASKRPAAGS